MYHVAKDFAAVAKSEEFRALPEPLRREVTRSCQEGGARGGCAVS